METGGQCNLRHKPLLDATQANYANIFFGKPSLREELMALSVRREKGDFKSYQLNHDLEILRMGPNLESRSHKKEFENRNYSSLNILLELWEQNLEGKVKWPQAG